ncbi:tail completion protein gp17 [Qipengyuania atrilutea]|uniref:DUF3168 domain-containing protein n=1 Tax=Qipengyuania atrilutea TaxID=2744473 RepID=A0A850GVF0_9SPHN|nr:hypothetical protein [Actirhodobacter atriluteus]NVD43484.1 hypothetical protein [Actirhodobacter atriluteus]
MSGVDIIGALLLADTAVTDFVPPSMIKAGRLPDGVSSRSLVVRSISLVERVTLKREALVRVRERVSVTIRAANYDDQKALTKLVRDACAGRTGTIANFDAVSVIAAGTGPDVNGPADTFEKAQDFMVGFNEPV